MVLLDSQEQHQVIPYIENYVNFHQLVIGEKIDFIYEMAFFENPKFFYCSCQ